MRIKETEVSTRILRSEKRNQSKPRTKTRYSCSTLTMECLSINERWDFSELAPEFLYTQIIFRNDEDYFWTRSNQRENKVDIQNIDPLDIHKIPRKHIFPPFEENLTKHNDSKRRDIYIKQPRFRAYQNSAALSSLLLQKARICQLLMQKPHPNIALYLGCITQEDRITAICFEMYAETLAQHLERNIPISNECLKAIEAGIKHLHTYNLVHNDLGVDNIMFRRLDSEEPVIIDFDSCVLRGSPLPAKRGSIPDGIIIAQFENDEYGLNKIRALIQSSK